MLQGFTPFGFANDKLKKRTMVGMRPTFQKGDRREEWFRFPGGCLGGWIRPNEEFISTAEAVKQGWRRVDGDT